jgi:RNA polymerase sigma-70 factor (ECF subfamily)
VPPEDTLQALRLARQGDTAAREALLARIRPRVVLWCAARMSSSMRAQVEPEDLAQEILLGVHGSLDSFDGDAAPAFYGWLFRIAENRIRDMADRLGALRRRPDDRAPNAVTTPSEAAFRGEVVARVRDAVGRLADDHRDVVRMRLLEGRSVADVAEAMQRSSNAVRVLYCRALRALRDEVPELA